MRCHLFLFIASSMFICCNDADLKRTNSQQREDLEKRIDEYYVSWKSRDFEKMWTLLSSRRKVGSEEEFTEAWKEVDLTPTSYSIIDISIEDGGARVKVNLTAVEHGEEVTGISFDYWQIESGKWFLVDSGRLE